MASLWIVRGTAQAKLLNFADALHDFQVASAKKSYLATAVVLVHTARCRLMLGSRSGALLAIREALVLDPGHQDALALRRRLFDLEGHFDGYTGARSRRHWRMARISYEACLKFYADEGHDAPIEVQCWSVELLIAEAKWESATSTIEYVICIRVCLPIDEYMLARILVQKDPKAIDFMILHAKVFFLTGKLSEALERVHVVLKLDPDSISAKALRSRVRRVKQSREEGISFYSAAEYEDAAKEWSKTVEVRSYCSRSGQVRLLQCASCAAGRREGGRRTRWTDQGHCALESSHSVLEGAQI